MFIGQNIVLILYYVVRVWGLSCQKNNNNKIPRSIVITFFLNYHLAEVGKLIDIVTFGI